MDFRLGDKMAANGEARQELHAHEETYAGFLTMLKVGAIAAFIAVAFVILMIAN